jgi:hypothetical protein
MLTQSSKRQVVPVVAVVGDFWAAPPVVKFWSSSRGEQRQTTAKPPMVENGMPAAHRN